jgi:hypothetical protein
MSGQTNESEKKRQGRESLAFLPKKLPEYYEKGEKKFRVPTFVFVAHGKQTEKLYHLERKAHDSIEKAARELGEVLDFGESRYWTHSLPEALANILEGHETGASETAAIAFLAKQGFKVVKGGE